MQEQTITTFEAAAWLREIRLREEAAGRNPNDDEEYRFVKQVVANCCGHDIDRWKEQRGYVSRCDELEDAL